MGELVSAEADEHQDGSKTPLPRAMSPVPPAAAPRDAAFDEMSIKDLVVCIRPVLGRIIAGDYPPATERHNAFIAGGRRREGLRDKVHTGNIARDKLHTINSEVRRWALRGERWAQMVQDEAEDGAAAEPDDVQPMASAGTILL